MVVSTDTVVWLTSRFGIPFLALIVLIGVFAFFLYPRAGKKKPVASDPLMSKRRIIPFYASVIEERTALKTPRKSRTKHLRSYSAQLTPPIKYLRQSPSHRHFRRNSSPTMSPHNIRRASGEEIVESSSTMPEIGKFLSQFPIQPPFNWQLESPCKRYSGSPIRSRHLIPRVGPSNLATASSPRMPSSMVSTQSTEESQLFSPDEKQ